MKKYFVVTIDAEIDKSRDWGIPEELTYQSIIKGIPQRLTPLFERYQVKPTYLLSSEIIENHSCVNVLNKLTNAELGAHLHGDLIDPERTNKKLAGIISLEMQCSYPKKLERAKLLNLKNMFVNTFGYSPESFRAGRFAIGNQTLPILSELGFKVDTSVTPGIEWIYPEGRSNHIMAPEQPYFPDERNFIEEGDLNILEVPVTIIDVNAKDPPEFLSFTWLRKKARRLIGRDNNLYWLRPSFCSLYEMIYAIKTIESKYRDCKSIVVNMMFHTNEIVPQASPYTSTERDCNNLLKKMCGVFEYCQKQNFQFVILSELYHVFKGIP